MQDFDIHVLTDAGRDFENSQVNPILPENHQQQQQQQPEVQSEITDSNNQITNYLADRNYMENTDEFLQDWNGEQSHTKHQSHVSRCLNTGHSQLTNTS